MSRVSVKDLSRAFCTGQGLRKTKWTCFVSYDVTTRNNIGNREKACIISIDSTIYPSYPSFKIFECQCPTYHP